MNQHFYINLDERKKRNEETKTELKKLGIVSPNRMSAVQLKVGLVGCALSHIKVIQKAKELAWSYCIIFEDDILIEDPEKLMGHITKYINFDYDVLYLGCWHAEPPGVVNNDLLRVRHAWTTHAYIIKAHYYDTMIENLREGALKKMQCPENNFYNLDEYVRVLQQKDKWYCLNPIRVTQRDGWSDNFNSNRNLSAIIKKIPQ
jgi:GR25 family glycosyltransferase involved in LPS biosynthesis